MKCPYCAEEIQNDAILCRYCGKDLSLLEDLLKENKQLRERISALEIQLSEATTLRDGPQGDLQLPGNEPTITRRTEQPSGYQVGYAHEQRRPLGLLFSAILVSAITPFLAFFLLGTTHNVLLFFATLLMLPTSLGFWTGVGWSGRHTMAYRLSALFAGLLGIGLLLLVYISSRGYASAGVVVVITASGLGIAALFLSGALFGDLYEKRKKGYLDPVAQGLADPVSKKMASRLSGQDEGPSQTALLLAQALGPALLTLVGTIITVFAGLART